MNNHHGDAVTGQSAQPTGPPTRLSDQERHTLLRLARQTLEQYLATSTVPSFEPQSEALQQQRGVFVTLRRGQQLRGCMGSLIARQPLYLEVQRSALMAALDDPRFPPVTLEELPQLHLEITVLGPLEPVVSKDDIQIGTHGLVIVKAGQQGTLLPQVAADRGWDADQFLVQLCRKAGLPDDAWQTAHLYRYTAEVFEE